MTTATPDPRSPESAVELTPARIGLGRAGGSVPTAAHLRFRADHAAARDAVRHHLDVERVIATLTSNGRPALAVTSAAGSRDEYIRRPDLGRVLSTEAMSALAEIGTTECDLSIVLCDGLSPGAVERYGPDLVERVASSGRLQGWSTAPAIVVRHGRVAIGDQIGELLRARLVVVLIGERPGLTISESVGAYITLGPRAGRTDADRNCISNIHERGLAVDEGARRIVSLAVRARAAGATGVALTGDDPPAITPR